MDDLDEMDKFLDTYNLPKLNKQITSTEIEAVVKNQNQNQTKKPFQQTKALDRTASQVNFIKHSKRI